MSPFRRGADHLRSFHAHLVDAARRLGRNQTIPAALNPESLPWRRHLGFPGSGVESRTSEGVPPASVQRWTPRTSNTARETRRRPMKSKGLEELFHDTLKDIYFAEKKILATLPKMATAAQSPELKAAFAKHHDETEGHVTRLEQVFALIDKKPLGKT